MTTQERPPFPASCHAIVAGILGGRERAADDTAGHRQPGGTVSGPEHHWPWAAPDSVAVGGQCLVLGTGGRGPRRTASGPWRSLAAAASLERNGSIEFRNKSLQK